MSSTSFHQSARTIVAIDDPDDPRIAVFRDIRERDLTGRDGLIAEGTVVLDQLSISTRFRPTALLVLKNRLDGLRERLSRLPVECPVYVVERQVIDAIAGFPMHRGVLAHGFDQAPPKTAADVLPAAKTEDGPILIGIGLANHDNVGSLFRNARAFGCGAVLLDETSCNPLYRKALRVSVGTVLTQRWHRGGTASDALDAIEAGGYLPIALTPGGRLTPETLDPSKPCALVVGAEGPGLSDAVLKRVKGLRIPMVPSVDSLNVATSAAIVLSRLYEMRFIKR